VELFDSVGSFAAADSWHDLSLPALLTSMQAARNTAAFGDGGSSSQADIR